MGLFRLLLLGAVIAAVLLLWRRFKNRNATAQQQPTADEPMVRCQHCRVHLPKAKAIETSQGWFCSQQHAEAGPREPR
ncbi:PP0621 family protein [Atopomonas hussainii]|uniref:PP0621 family protein n=1 Tax=Atopomonas hussainii TaxID=1429083 RepID=UPI0009004880|nr:PP0621 family protein [Atopomonas hussainii]